MHRTEHMTHISSSSLQETQIRHKLLTADIIIMWHHNIIFYVWNILICDNIRVRIIAAIIVLQELKYIRSSVLNITNMSRNEMTYNHNSNWAVSRLLQKNLQIFRNPTRKWSLSLLLIQQQVAIFTLKR